MSVCVTVLCLLSFSLCCSTAQAAGPPNIVFLLVDDVAWSDPACYGHRWHATPNIDQLASAGLRFTNAYAPAPICSASRASILTGKTPARLNFEFVTKNAPGRQVLDAETPLRAPPLTLNLPVEERTIAECLGEAGYQTAFFGKWHVNAHHQRYLGWSPTHGPRQQGFDFAVEDFGGHPYGWQTDSGRKPPERISTPDRFPRDSMVDRVCDFISKPHPAPYFLMVSEFYVHTPIETPCQWLLEKYEQRIPATAANRDKRVRYAAFVETLDHHIGRILDQLDQSNLTRETVVVFISDNGGHPEYTANSPLRGSKWNLYEGGIRVPLLIRWPGRIAPSTTCDVPVIGYDLLPTFADLAGVKCRTKFGIVDGLSLASVFDDPDVTFHRSLIWHFPYYHPERGFAAAPDTIGVDDFITSRTRPQSALRRGRYKLIHFYEDGRNELYDLQADPSEQNDLSAKRRKLAQALSEELEQRLGDMQARLPIRKN